MRKFLLLILTLFLLLGFKQKDKSSPLSELVYVDRYLRTVETDEDLRNINEDFLSLNESLKFLQQNGSNWKVLIDKRRGVPTLIDGGAIPFIPGLANNLKFEDFGAICNSIQCIPKEKVEEIARNFLLKYPGLFPVKQEEIQIDPNGTLPVGESIYLIRFQWYYNNIPVERGSIYFLINNGNLIQISSKSIAPINLDTNPSITRNDAFLILQQYLGREKINEKDKILNDGSLLIIPVTKEGFDPNVYIGPIGNMASFKLVYRFIFKKEGIQGTWEALIDAHSGQVLRFVDINRYGKIQGGVYKTDKNPTQTEVTMPFPYADYGSGLYSDIGGNFPGTSGTSTMTGRTGSAGNVGAVDINDNCGAISLSSDAQGLIDFGSSGGTDCTTPGFGGAGNTHSARTQYYNVAWIKIKAYTYLSGNTWLQGVLTDNVNLNQTCNAYWDGTAVNFFRSGGGCGNTGELPGVSLHEWGHGMDDNDGSGGNSPPVETRADWTAIMQTHQSCAGGGFFVTLNLGCGQVPPPGTGYNCGGYGDCCLNCSGIRDADWDQHQSHTPWTPVNHGSIWNCGGGWYNGPCGWEDHCESGISTQALWDMAVRDLPTYCGMDTTSAWQLIDRLWYSSMPQLANMYTCTPPNSSGCTGNTLYNLFRGIDDDGDGTANGTPHAQGIFQALARHNIACGNAGDPANQNQTSCPSLTPPTLSGVAGSNSVTLNWNSVINATRYFVFRNDTSCDSGFTKIATVYAPTTNYTDNTTSNGITSYYRVQAATGNDSCVSPMSNCVAVTPQPCAGSVTLDSGLYNCSDTGTITVLDSTAPSSPFTVEIWSTTDPTHRTVQVTGVPSTYTGTFATTTGTPGPNQVKVSNGDTIYVRYTDPDYCGTPNVQVDTTATVDCTPPIISNVQVSNITDNSAVVNWDTDENSNSRVTYGTSTPPSINKDDLTTFTTNHSIQLTNLTSCTDYYFSVTSADIAGNSSTDNNSGTYYHFKTFGRSYSFLDQMESGTNGWTTTGLWHQINEPTCSPSASSPTHSWYFGQNSTCTFDTGATVNGRLVSPTISNLPPNSILKFNFRKQTENGCPAYDVAYVQISTNGGSTWTNLGSAFCEESNTWTISSEYDLSSYAGSNINIGFYFDSIDNLYNNYLGWMIDDVAISSPMACGPLLEYNSSSITDACNGTGSGNNDGIIDAGENILLQITLHNNGTFAATGVYATISTTTPGITITDNYATFPNIPAGETRISEANHFSFFVGTSVACGTQINFTININSNEDSWSDTFSLTVGQVLPGVGTVLNENFSGGIPASWTVVDGGSGGGASSTWTTANPCSRTANSPIVSPFAIVDSDCAGSSATQDEQLITPVLNLSTATSVTLEFDHYFYWYSGGNSEIGDVDIRSSKTGGAWVNIIRYQNASSPNPQHVTQDITAQAAGASNVQIRFHYYNGTYEWYWMIDNVKVTYTVPSGCQMNACTPSASPPPPVNHTASNAAKFTKGSGNTINVTYDNTTCSADHISILYNTIGVWNGYSGCALSNGGSTGSTSFDSTGQSNVWYNIIWVNGSVGGHPGFSSTGERTWDGSGLCGITSDDHSDNSCN